MRNRFGLAACLMVIAAVVAWWQRPAVPPPPESDTRQSTYSTPPMRAERESGAVEADRRSDILRQVAEAKKQTVATSAPDTTHPFRVDDSGALVKDEQTRLNIEAVFALTDPANLFQVQQEITRKLPPAAAAEAALLIEHYQNYSEAQRQAYAPGVMPATEEAALAELDGLHALRVAHFGAETAQAFYGNEEKITRSLIDLMRLEKDQSLTLQEKAVRAQQLYDAVPEMEEPEDAARSP